MTPAVTMYCSCQCQVINISIRSLQLLYQSICIMRGELKALVIQLTQKLGGGNTTDILAIEVFKDCLQVPV